MKALTSFPLRLINSFFIAIVRLYQLIISPHLPNSCRFTPTCSQYCIDCFKKHGPLKSFYLTAKRLSSCHPWSGKHGHDPVP